MPSRISARLSLACTILLFGFSACAPGRSAPPPPAAPVWQPEPESLDESPEIIATRITAPRRNILEGVEHDLPLETNSWVEAEFDFLVNERREVIGRWLERGAYYEEFIKEELRRQEIPTDLFQLAMIESGFVPTARSRAGAVGMWQFMPATGRAMGLRIDNEVDERMDPVRSTRAAVRHLRDLKRSMGSWALAAAAYNAGPGRINRGLRAFDANDFWELAERGDLADETKHYVPRLYAMTVISRTRDRYGFAAESPERFAFDSIHVDLATPLPLLASMAEVEPEVLVRLNPHLVRGITPAGGYWVWVPSGQGAELQRRYLASEFRKQNGLGTYVVKRGDFLGRIASRAGMTMAEVRELNSGVNFDPLQIGAELRMPRTAIESLERHAAGAGSARLAEAKTVASATPAGGASVHRVRSGETLWQIAREHGTTVDALQQANSLSSSTIRPGMQLTLPSVGEPEGQTETASVTEHVVQGGDTLWGIARRYGTSVDAIRQANELGERAIRPGQRLTVPL